MNAAPLPAPSSRSPILPRPEQELRCAAGALVAPAASLLVELGGTFLTVAAERTRRCTKIRVLLWGHDFRAGTEITGAAQSDPRLSKAVLALRDAGGDLARHLGRRWPANAVPATIGVVTDGAGVAIFPDHPGALSPDWLQDHLAGIAAASILVPFPAHSPWTLLSADRDQPQN